MFELWRTWQPVALHDGPTIGPAPAPPAPAVKPPAGPVPAEPAVKDAPKPVGDKPAVGTRDTVQLQSAAPAQTALELTAKAKTLTEKLGVLQGKMVELLKDVPNAQKVAKERELKAEVVNQGLQDFLAHANMDPDTRKKVEAYLAAIPAKDLGTRALVVDALKAAADRGQLNGALITQLSLLSDPRTPLASGIDRERLVRETLQDLADPSRIDQGRWGTCAATSVQMVLALRDPARYVQLVRLLASEEGDASAVVPELKRPADQNLKEEDKPPPGRGGSVVGEGERSLTTRLLSSAFMNYAAGHYHSKTDMVVDSKGRTYAGLDEHPDTFQQQHLIEGVLGLKVSTVQGKAGDPKTWERVDQAQQKGHIVPVGLKWKGSGHAVLYAGKEKDKDGREYALLINPQGHRHRMPIEEFRKRLEMAQIPDDGQKKPSARPAGWDKLEAYEPLPYREYMTTPDLLEKVPAELREFVKKYDLSPAFVENFLLPLALSSGRVDDAAIERLQSVAARYGKDMAADALVLECQLQAGGMDQATRDRLLHLLDRQKAFTEPVVGALMEKSNKITPQLIDELEKARDAESISHVLETVK